MRKKSFVLFGLITAVLGFPFRLGRAQTTPNYVDKEYESRHRLKKNQLHQTYLECDFYDKKFCLITLTTADYYEGRRHDPIWLNPGTKVVWLADGDQKFTIKSVKPDMKCQDIDLRGKVRDETPFDSDVVTSTPVSYVETHIRHDATKGTCFDVDIQPVPPTPGAKSKTIDPHVYVGDGS